MSGSVVDQARNSRAVLVLNAGSSSTKFALHTLAENDGELGIRVHGQIAGIGREPVFTVRDATGTVIAEAQLVVAPDHGPALDFLLDWIRAQVGDVVLSGVGLHVVHGGRRRTAPVRVSPQVFNQLGALSPLAPHHQPHNVQAIQVLAERDPELLRVACFDLAFHAGQSDTAPMLPLPREDAEHGLQGYGFYGLSYEYISEAVAGLESAHGLSRVVVAHLGNGASLCAVREGRSIATTMGFSTPDGLMMGTRSGAIDPGVSLHLMHEGDMAEAALTDLLCDRSGLLGMSVMSADMQQLLASDDPRAAGAIDLYGLTLVKQTGATVVVLAGVDAIVFTGGIGEHAVPIRVRVCERLRGSGVDCDRAANAAGQSRVGTADSRLSVWVIPTDAERVIARHAVRLLDRVSG